MSEFEVEVANGRDFLPANTRKQRAMRALRWLIRPRVKVWLVLGLLAGCLLYGTPHLLITYRCHKSGGKCQVFTACNYVGVQGWRAAYPDRGRCAYLRLLPIRWG